MYYLAEHHARMEMLKEQGSYQNYIRGRAPELGLIKVPQERIDKFSIGFAFCYYGWLMGAFALLIYFNWLWLIPRYLEQAKYWAYILGIIASLLVLGLILAFHNEFTGSSVLANKEGVILRFPPFVEIIGAGLGALCLTTPIYLSYHWFIQQNKINELRNEQLTTELAFLKNQINPHFFFNTLNNLYALTLENSKAAPKVILKLSDLMRYTLYEGREEKVSLDQEIRCLYDYLELQQLRIHKPFDLRFEQQVEAPSVIIPPLLFLTLIENAFKHGVDTLTTGAYVHIELKSNENQLIFKLKNNFDPSERKSGSGTGHRNTKRRLDLLYPDDRHTLSIQDEQSVFTLKMTIDL